MLRLLILSILLFCGACTTSVSVQRVVPTDPATRVGIPYPLMFNRYEIEITRQVAGCGAELKALVKAEVKSVEGAPDPKQLFVIDPNSLASPLKTSEIKVEFFPNGGVSTLNATAEDRSAQVLANVVATAVKVVSIAAAAGASTTAAVEACSKEVLAARKVVTEKTPVVEAAVKLVDARTEEVSAINKKIASMGSNGDERTKAALSKAYDALTAALEDLADKKAVLEKAVKVITYVETVRWPAHGDMSSGDAYLLPAVLRKWGAVDTNPNSVRRFAVFFSLEGIGLISRDLAVEDVVDPKRGIPFRQPVLGRLRVCAGAPCDANNLPIAEKTGDVLQLGYVYYLPCESRAFTSISCTFAMTESGQLKSMGAAQKAASAEGLSGAAKDTVTQIGSLQETLAGAKAKKLEAQTAALKAQADYASAAAALQPDPSQPDKDQTAALKASTGLLDAKRAQLEAEAALADAVVKAAKATP